MAPRASLPFRFFVDLVLDSPKDQTWCHSVGHHGEAEIANDGSVYTFMERGIDEPACSAAREYACLVFSGIESVIVTYFECTLPPMIL